MRTAEGVKPSSATVLLMSAAVNCFLEVLVSFGRRNTHAKEDEPWKGGAEVEASEAALLLDVLRNVGESRSTRYCVDERLTAAR